MKRAITALSILVIVCITAFAFSHRPTTFKTDMENTYSTVTSKLTALANSHTHQDSADLYDEIDATFSDLNNKRDVSYEMRNAATYWPNPVLGCALGCLSNYNSCVHNNDPGTWDGQTLCAIWYNQCLYNCNAH